ncbi:hypothetical protein MKZ38_004296 [Zalerion maritima]|uniref:Altered inheritance of mitochondria protein 21 n=1 Tax=Zalerion maritima TaxID=339359 RepID=A0AAD5WR39_9PEZI|nr:hypothetical protein MKZ38_004296 [Zalerion maritima]
MSAPPVVPPRPARTEVKDDAPMIPPRPAGRAISPHADRFAQSPLNANLKAKNGKTLRFDENEPTERPRSVVDMPSLGEEGMEYAVLPETKEEEQEEQVAEGETHTVGDDVKLAAPKPKLPAQTAKDRVAAVTRTDSDRAAAFGIGRPSSEERSLRKKGSTVSQVSGTDMGDDKEGIPEIGQRIPLLSHAGDVQAPSPAPGSTEGLAPRHHSRQTSARGFVDLPNDSYGLHGHGRAPRDKLDKAYYEKHPELLQRERVFQRHEHDRANDFSLTSDDLNSIVRETRTKSADPQEGMPTEDLSYDAHVEYASRQSRPTSTVPDKEGEEEDEEHIHIEPEKEAKGRDEEREYNYSAPILADDEVARDPKPYEQVPAVPPQPERSGSAFEMEEPKSRSTSRPTSMHVPTFDIQEAPLEDVHEYEPLFLEDEKESRAAEKKHAPHKQRFPSKDVWEDAPNSVYATTEVSSPQPPKEQSDIIGDVHKIDPKKVEHLMATAKAEDKPRSWVEKQLKMSDGTPEAAQKRFPSRDIWEDSPNSLQLQTTVSAPQQDEEQHSPVETSKPKVPARPGRKASDDGSAEKPVVPERLTKTKPAVPDKPKPAVGGRVGGKIAALQAGFMADLNKRLQTGPSATKKEEPVAQDLTEEKEKAPLSDARKSRARGPQRRAPAASKSPSSAAIDESPLSFSTPRTIWVVEPEEGALSVSDYSDDGADEEPPKTLATNMAGESLIEERTNTPEVADTKGAVEA